MQNRLLPCLSFVVALAGAGTAHAVTVFVDRSAFAASFSQPLLAETFDTEIATADRIVFSSGIASTKSSSGVPPTLNRVKGGDFDGFVVRDGFRNIDWTPPTPAFGFGGDFSGGGTAFTSLFVTAAFQGGGSFTTSIAEALGNMPGFFGLNSARAFSSLTFSTDTGIATGGTPVGGQVFSVDNVALSPVPLPAGLALLLGALGLSGAGLTLTRRRAQRR